MEISERTVRAARRQQSNRCIARSLIFLHSRSRFHYDGSILRRAGPNANLPTVRLLLQDIASGIRVLQSRDGVALSDEQILERARNIVAGLVGNYKIVSLDPTAPRSRARTTEQLDLLAAIERADLPAETRDEPERRQFRAARRAGACKMCLLSRGVAQPGSASALGAECRRFESSRPDRV